MSFVYLSHNAYTEVTDWIKEQGHSPVLVPDSSKIYPEICSHADLFLCRLGNDAASPLFSGIPVGREYPECAALCAAANSEYFIHNTKITDPELLLAAQKVGLKVVHVNQGFTRCNLLPVGSGFITGDFGVNRALEAAGLNVLLVSWGHICLPGHRFGFIGGCAGIIGNTVVFNGDITLHPDHEKILAFIALQGYSVKYFPLLPLVDIGSIIESDTEVRF